MRRGDTTTQTRRRSTISKLDRPGETGGDAEGGGSDAVGAFCLTLIGHGKARRARFKDEEKKVKSGTGMAKW